MWVHYLGRLMQQSEQQETELGSGWQRLAGPSTGSSPMYLRPRGLPDHQAAHPPSGRAAHPHGRGCSERRGHTQWRRIDAFYAATSSAPRAGELISNEQLYELAQIRPIKDMVRQHTLRLLGHLDRMAEGAMALRIGTSSGRSPRDRVGGGSHWPQLAWN